MSALFLEIALRAALIAAGTAFVLWALQVRSAAVRHTAWTAVVVAMLVLPLGIAVGMKVPVEVLDRDSAIAAVAVSSSARTTPSTQEMQPETLALDEPATMAAPAQSSPGWPAIALGFYVTGAALLLLHLGVGTWQANRLRRTSITRAGRLTSDRCATPVTVGWFRPALILPAGWHQWSDAQLSVVLTHEQAHARRRDPLVQWLALLNRAVFWFHPLAWWLERQVATLAEEACDAAVLVAGHTPREYSEYLIDMARSVSRAGRRIQPVGMAMPGRSLTHRVRQIFNGLPLAPASRAHVISTLALCALSSGAFAAGELAVRSGPSSQSTPSATGARPRYEAATIKPCPPEDKPATGGPRGSAGGTNASISPGRFTVPCVTTEQLIYLAYASYGARPEQRLQNDDFGTASNAEKIRGGPDWVHSTNDKYAIEAIAPGVTERTVLMGDMLQTLLEERFALKLHRESEELPMFALTTARTGLKLKPMKGDECEPNAGPPPYKDGQKPACGNLTMLNSGGRIHWTFSASQLSSLASMLSRTLGVHVIDRTNVDDKFMFEFKFFHVRDGSSQVRDAAGRDVTAEVLTGPSVHDALDQQLGLKLDRIKAPREFIVIDSIRRPVPDDQPPSQSGAKDARQAFDVVSIRPCASETLPPAQQGGRVAGPGNATTSPGRAYWACVTGRELIRTAYAGSDLRLHHSLIQRRPGDPEAIRGGPSWLDSEKFTVEARAAGGADRITMIGPMLRALLEDRFQLKTRRATEERPLYSLTVAKGGLKVKRTTPSDCSDADAAKPCGNVNMDWNGSNRKLTLTGFTLKHLAENFLSDLVMDRFVVDDTGLDGRFNVQVEFAPDDNTPGGAANLNWVRRAGAEAPTAPSIFRAFEEQLGLKLSPVKGPAEYLVIDSVQRPKPNVP